MTDVPPPPPSAAPPPPPPPGGEPPLPPPGPPPKKGLSTGAKIAIGCGAVLLLLLILIVTCIGFGAKKLGDLGDAMEDQERAGEVAQKLEREHPFRPPPNGELDENHVNKFFAVTDDAWKEIEDWAKNMQERGERIDREGGQAGFRDAMAAAGGMGRARLSLVKALDEHDMAPAAYVWTGATLMRAYQATTAESPDPSVPDKNLEMARKNADKLAELQDDDDDEPDKSAVLGLAYVFFPRPDLMLPPGVDTTLGR